MKQIIEVTVNKRKVELEKCKADLLCLGITSGAKKLDPVFAKLDKSLTAAVSKLIQLGDFKGKESSSALVYGNEKIGIKRILLVGLGEKKKITADTFRKAAAIAAGKAVDLKSRKTSIALHNSIAGKLDLQKIAQAITEGAFIGSYRYDEFVTEKKNGRLKTMTVEIVDPDAANIRKISNGISTGTVTGRAQSFARTIANRPGNVITPRSLAAEARKMAAGVKGLTCTVFDDKQLKQKKMGGILAVGSGSKNKPGLIVLKYTPPVKTKLPAIALVGKAITFDSGGISIKPSSGMHEMKFDKSGGIAVLGAIKAVAELKIPVKVFGIIPAAENMPGPASYRPGDIITTYSGKTVEIQNTDAEGRMILCDAIHYAVKQKCATIIDIATLTGACMVALGKHKAGLMGNNDRLIKKLQAASKDSGEELWHLPSGNEYLEEMKSKIADLKNIGTRWGGACSAAAFLGSFAAEAKWAHIDMAGTDMSDAASNCQTPGATGFGVRLLTTYLLNAAKNK